MTIRHYATLFDSRYLPQGLALYESLVKHSSSDFRLYVLPMDAACWEMLTAMALPQMEVLDYAAFELTLGMHEVKMNRTWQEYCWTAGSNLAYYTMLRMPMELPEISYVDADCWVMSDPQVIFDEIGNKSVGIIPHRFAPEHRRLEINGRFNVSLVHFKNTPVGRECLNTWARQVRERCSATMGCGDQLYLNEWPALYKGDVHEIENIGVGLAPWNLSQYRLTADEGGVCVDGQRINLFHFHEFRKNDDGTFRLTNYDLRPEDINLIYMPYLEAIQRADARTASLSVVDVRY